MTPTTISAPLTPKADTRPHIVKLKVFWKTTRKWTVADVADYQASAPELAEQIRTEKYRSKGGDIHSNRFTCEDFAVRLLIQYAASKGLPIKLVDGVRTYRNMEVYGQPAHGKYDSSMYGFADMVELTYGAPDMQRINSNSISLPNVDDLRPGDILALTKDLKGQMSRRLAHHIQLVVSTSKDAINIYQGNSDDTIHRPITWINKILGRNAADPQQPPYAGLPIEIGAFYKTGMDGTIEIR
ncbi:hypothetical protein HHL24_21190 [Paraburkholderia sp. RP-4-7]|uniref:Uncharacterized protein n=1 Tax=Paraburkholderia polaris TaxID=2728848 RepID=A0A848IFN3_9BURK|nr:hypothetical protein [Paraburkholderia polaris]NMM00441.1 hypothetical protein [Paraburkholderia polaris]